jgi:uncharacterized protein
VPQLLQTLIVMTWALIAGGSKGIGLSIAKALARRNYNLILVARDADILLDVQRQIENIFDIEVDILACDLSLPSSAELIFTWCSDNRRDIDILCNSAGMGGTKDLPYLSIDELRKMVTLNFESAVVLSSLFVPLMKSSSPSYILNVSSMAGFSAISIKSIYSATKSALISFSYSLKYILKPFNISVSCLCPGPVFTKPAIKEETIRQMGWIGRQMVMESDVVGELAVKQMFEQKMIIIPGKMAKLLCYVLRILPMSFVARIIYAKRVRQK